MWKIQLFARVASSFLILHQISIILLFQTLSVDSFSFSYFLALLLNTIPGVFVDFTCSNLCYATSIVPKRLFNFWPVNSNYKANILTNLSFPSNFFVDVKSALSGLRQFLAAESPLKMMKNAIHFTLKAFFAHSKYLKSDSHLPINFFIICFNDDSPSKMVFISY